MSLLEKVKKATPPALWSRAEDYVRQGGVYKQRGDDSEEIWSVQIPGRSDRPTITLWPQEQDWECDCGAQVAACAHTAAAVLARSQGNFQVQKSAPAVIRYALKRHPSGLILDRTAPPDAPRRPADQELNRLLPSWWGRPNLPRELMMQAIALLDGVPGLTLDSQPIQASRKPVLPRIVIQDKGTETIVVRLVRASGIDEAFVNGVLRMGDTLHPIGEPSLDPNYRQRLIAGIPFDRPDWPRLVSNTLPALQKLMEVEVQTQRLPEVIHAPPRLDLQARTDGFRLSVTPRIVYGSPPIAWLERGKLLLRGRKLPVRDEAGEERIREQLREAGLGLDATVEREGEGAIRFLEALQGPVGELIRQAAPQFRRVREVFTPQVSLHDAPSGEGVQLTVETGGVRPEALLDAWRAGASWVPMEDGGWRPVPREWLERHGAILQELVAASDDHQTLPPSAAPLIMEASEALQLAAPPSLDPLRALAGDFRYLPTAPLPPGFSGQLRPYQQKGVDWMYWLKSTGLGGVLADDMGLGKTVQCLCLLALSAGQGRPSLVVAPTSVIRNWEAEARRFFPRLSVCVYHGGARVLDPSADLVLTTYALLRLDNDALRAVAWEVVVLDEAQAIKNPEAQVTQASFRLRAQQRLALSGTPIENRLSELWSLFHFLSPGMLGSLRSFEDRFATPIASGSRAARDLLRKRLRPFLMRRLKREVARDLPPRTDIVLRCALSEEERTLYRSVATLSRQKVAEMWAGGKALSVLEVLLRMRQAACHGGLLAPGWEHGSSKVELLMEQLEEVTAEGHAALVFSQWTSLLDRVEPALRQRGISFVRLDGTTRDRAAVVSRFQAEDGPPVFLLSLKAGGTGLNLTRADYVFLLDPWWNPAVEEQAADRAHRIGQERPVVVYRLVSEDTVEEGILKLQESKRDLARAALDDDALASALTREDILALFDT